MRVKTVDTSDADRVSARVFFEALFQMYDLERAKTLDAFARNGQLTVSHCAPHLYTRSQMHLWELGQEHERALRAITPNTYIGCSYARAQEALQNREKYDLIVVDTPQGLHKDGQGNTRVEHFDFLPYALGMTGDSSVIVLYVNKRPYDRNKLGSHGYDEYEEYDYAKWMQHRLEYYGRYQFVSEEEAIAKYRSVVGRHGFTVKSVLSVPCFSDVPGLQPYAFRLALEIVR